MVSKCIIATNLIHSTNKVEILKYNDMVREKYLLIILTSEVMQNGVNHSHNEIAKHAAYNSKSLTYHITTTYIWCFYCKMVHHMGGVFIKRSIF